MKRFLGNERTVHQSSGLFGEGTTGIQAGEMTVTGLLSQACKAGEPAYVVLVSPIMRIDQALTAL